MTYKEIEEYLQSRDGDRLEQLITKYANCFEEIGRIGLDFSNGCVSNKMEIEKALDVLTGHYMTLKEPAELTDTWKEHYQNEFYNKLKSEAAEKNEKFVDGVAKQLASESVQIYRRVRNIFNLNIDRADKGISTCQSKLKNLERESSLRQNANS